MDFAKILYVRHRFAETAQWLKFTYSEIQGGVGLKCSIAITL